MILNSTRSGGIGLMLFRKRAVVPDIEFDRENQRAVLKCSICNGEQVAGFKDIHTGKFTEVMLIRSDRDLNAFMKKYDISSLAKEY